MATTKKKDKKITIMTFTTVKDELNQVEEIKAPLKGGENIWAYYRQASAEEFLGAAVTNYKVEAIFKIGWRNDLHPSMSIMFRGKEYGITRIDDFEGYKQDLTIYAYALN
ncbi:head-tail adaptor protein [Bacillus cereus]|nr:head-tail adaptor protein [Bacillus cereus]